MKKLNKSTVKKKNPPAKILQFGEGNFLRAFVDWMIDKANKYGVMNHGVVAVQPIIGGEFVANLFNVQDCMYHVYPEGIKDKQPVKEVSLVKSINEVLNPYTQYTDFRAKKVRILNGAHTAMEPVALQIGCETVMDAFKTPELEKYINQMVTNEVLAVIDEDPEELKVFAAKILERFYNPYLKHYLKDISLNSISKWETCDYPTAYDNYKKLNKDAKLTILSFAALLVLYSGESEVSFTPNDTAEFIQFIQSTFKEYDINGWVRGIVTHKEMWKENFSEVPQFIDEVTEDVKLILNGGMLKALKTITY